MPASVPTTVTADTPTVVNVVDTSGSAPLSLPPPRFRLTLRETDVAHAVGMASTNNAEQIVNSLLASYETARTHDELLRQVHSMFVVRRDAALYLRERIFQRLTSGNSIPTCSPS